MSGTLHYRVRFRDPFDTRDVLVVSTVPTDDNPFITEPPRGDGTKIDPLTGVVEVGEYVVQVADEVGTITLPTMILDEQWLYENQAARNVVWPKTTSLAAPYAGGDSGGYDGIEMRMGITYGGGLGGGGGFGKHTRTVTGLTPGAEYTVVCDWMTLSRTLGFSDNCGMSLNGGQGQNPYNQSGNQVLEGPVIHSATADGSGEITITLGHFDLEYGMTGILITAGRIRIFGPGEELETRVVTGWLGDGDGQWQVLGVRAFVEESTNVGDNWTTVQGAFVTHVDLAGGIEYAITLGESDRRERMAQVFTKEEGDFEATRIIGAPSGFGPLEDAPYDSWVFRVTATGDTDGDMPADAVQLEFVRGYVSEDFIILEPRLVERSNSLAADTVAAINQRAAPYMETVGGVTTFAGLTARIYADASGQPGDLVGEAGVYSQLPVLGTVGYAGTLIDWGRIIALQWRPGDGGITTLPSVGTLYHIIVTPDVVNEDNPLHYVGHLVDFVTELFNLRQISYDATSAAAVKAALGQMRAYYRFTAAEPLMDAVEKYAFGPGGFAVRPTPEGEWEFILTRHLPSVIPSETLTEAKVHDPETVIFSLDIRSIVNRIVWKQRHWTLWRESMNTEPPPDGIIGREQTTIVEPELSLIADLGTRELVYELPGEIIIKSDGSPKVSAGAWFVQMGTDILRRWGRGCPEAEVKALRGQSAADIGDFILLDLGHLPTAETGREPTAQRIQESGSTRIVQVIHRTRTPAGFEHRVLDVGPGDDATELVPEFTLALTSDDPRHTAEATLTNHGDLAGFLVRMEMGTGSVEPDGGVTVEVFTPDDLPHRTFPEEACTTVWVRMRAEPELGGVPGAWSDWQSEDLDCIPAVTDLSADAGDNCTEELVTWTVGDADLAVRVRWKLTAATDYTNVVTLPAGSTQYTIAGLVPGSAYTVEVAHLDASPFSNAGTVATDTWTACGDTPVLDPPIDPAGFSNGAGTYGMTVTATEIPSNVEFWQAVEDSPGAGTYGSFVLVASPASQQVGSTVYTSIAPNDGLTYQIKARHTRTGWTASAYTDVVTVDPWGDPVTPPPGNALSQSTDTFPIELSGIGGSIEWVGLLNGGLALRYSVDGGANWPFFNQAAAGAYTSGDGPYVSLEASDVQEGPWLEMATEARANLWWQLVAIEPDGTITEIVESENAKVCAGYKYVRLIAKVLTAGTVTTDPVTYNVHVEFAAVAQQVVDPPTDPEPPEGIEGGCSSGTIYPVVRALEWWAVADDCGNTFSDPGTGPKVLETLADLSGNGNTGTKDAGATVKRFTDSDGQAIPQINGRDPLSFKDAFLDLPAGMFTGFTEGELFMVVKGNDGDPNANTRDGSWSFGGTTSDSRWAEDTGGGAGTGQIKEDFGSTVAHATGDVTGSLASWRIYNVRAKAGHYAIYVDGVEEYSSSSNTVAWAAAPELGNRSDKNSHFHFAEGSIHSSILTTAERALVIAAIEARWGL
jgi:hypothetical protein